MKRSLIEIFTPSVSKQVLLLVAGFVWMLASFILMYKGIIFLKNGISYIFIKSVITLAILIFFYNLLVNKVSVKYLNRIVSLKKDRPCVFSFFNIKGYILMIFMMSLGIGLKQLKFIPLSYLTCLYIGIGIPLFISSLRFYIAGIKFKRKKILLS